MSAPVRELYDHFHAGLQTTPGPQDPLFSDVWETYTSVVTQVEYLLLSDRFGPAVDGADEVALYRARFSRVASVSCGMPLRIPTPAAHAVQAMGRFFEGRIHVDDIGDFLELASPIVNDFSAYSSTHLGRLALPIIEALSVTSRSAALMHHCATSLVPGLNGRKAPL